MGARPRRKMLWALLLLVLLAHSAHAQIFSTLFGRSEEHDDGGELATILTKIYCIYVGVAYVY